MYILRCFYFGLVQSKLQYGITCWGGMYYSSLQPTIIGQKFIIRNMLFKNKMCSSFPLFRKLRIMPLRHLYVFKVLKLFYLRSGNRNIRTTVYNLRTNNICDCPFAKIEHFNKFYLTVAPLLFNRLPDELKLCSPITIYLSKLRIWILEMENVEHLFLRLQ